MFDDERSVITIPYKPRKPCACPGCPELVPPGTRYCERHQKQADRDYDRYHRPTEHQERYHTGAWAKIRTAKLHTQPLCERCLGEGRYTHASIVHHIRPLAGGGTNALDNLMSLCAACHNKIHYEMKNDPARAGGGRNL